MSFGDDTLDPANYKPQGSLTKFGQELQALINKHSQENISNTPDFILAQFLQNCLDSFDCAVQQRERWYGRRK